MKAAVICANGKAGKLITAEAVQRGLDVTAIVRSTNKSVAPKAIQKDIFDLTREDLAGFDVVFDAFGAWEEKDLPQYSTVQAHLLECLKGTETRLIIIGGAGSLYLDKTHTTRLLDAPNFPEIYRPVSTAAAKALSEIRSCTDVKWTVVSPAADFQAEGERTGEYILAGEEFTLNAKGESIVSYADYAIALVDEAVNGNHIRERISVVGK